jgi:hypothetical protein
MGSAAAAGRMIRGALTAAAAAANPPRALRRDIEQAKRDLLVVMISSRVSLG